MANVYAGISNYNAALSAASVRARMLGGAWSSQLGLAKVNVANPLAITPTFGASIIEGATLNGNMEAINGWLATGTPLVNERSADQARSGTYSRKIQTDFHEGIYQDIGGTTGTWYQLSDSAWSVDVSGDIQVLWDSVKQHIVAAGNGAWKDRTLVYRKGNGSNNIIFKTPSIFGTFYIDDIIVKPITLASTLGTAYDVGNDGWFEAIVTALTTGTQAGIWIALDSEVTPANGYLIYLDGTNLKVDQVKAGVYINLQTTAVTYGNTKRLCVWKLGTAIRAYYGDALVGVQLTGDAALTGTKMALVSTFASNTFSNLVYLPVQIALQSWA